LSALTKIFIVLQLVCSLELGVLLVVVVKGQENYRKNADDEHKSMLVAQAGAALKSTQLGAKQAEVDRLTQALTSAAGDTASKIRSLQDDKVTLTNERDAARNQIIVEGTKVSQLTSASDSQAKEIARLNPEVQRLTTDNAKLIQQNAELSRQNNECVTQLRYAEQAIRKLQEALATANANKGGAAATSDSGTVASLTVQTPTQINGKVTRVDAAPSGTLVELPLGTRDGVRVGTVFTVSRNGSFIADVKVSKVTPSECVAATTENAKKGTTPMAGDIATSGSAQ